MKAKTLNTLKRLWADESGQGAAEYIMLLVVVVGIVMMFRDRIATAVSGKLDELQGDIQGVSSNL